MSEAPAQLLPSKTSVMRDESFAYDVLNVSDETISFGTPYRLERLLERGWVDIRHNYKFSLPLYLLAPGSSRELNARVPPDAAFGRYRLVKNVRAKANRAALNPVGPAITVSFEFDVVAGSQPADNDR
jgi:hypothetical protein